MKIQKKILLSLGVATIVVAPISTVIACGATSKTNSDKNDIPDGPSTTIITIGAINNFVSNIRNSILFVGGNHHGSIEDNKELNGGINGLTFEYGWSDYTSHNPSAYVPDYKQIHDFSRGDIFVIKIKSVASGYLLENQNELNPISVCIVI